MQRPRPRLLVGVFIAIVAIGAATFASPPPASADPACDAPGTPPCAGPEPLTPEQRCQLMPWRVMPPCNDAAIQNPIGIPGTWG
jgi:hypothetical protein